MNRVAFEQCSIQAEQESCSEASKVAGMLALLTQLEAGGLSDFENRGSLKADINWHDISSRHGAAMVGDMEVGNQCTWAAFGELVLTYILMRDLLSIPNF